MAIVPTYTPTERDRPIHQQGLTTRATPQDFGSDIGRGLQALAQGGQQVSQALAQVADLEDTAKAQVAERALADWDRERRYGPNGFLTLSGAAAVDGRAAYEKELSAKRLEIGLSLSPGAQLKYKDASEARMAAALETAAVHTARERKAMIVDGSNARLATITDDAIDAYNNPIEIATSIDDGLSELRRQGSLLGWDADTLRNREDEFISGVHHDVAMRMLVDDPLAAQAYLEANRVQMTGQHQYELEKALEPNIKREQAKQEAGKILELIQSGDSDVVTRLQAIEDPDVREMAWQTVSAVLNLQNSAERAERDGATEEAYKLIETRGLTPYELPPEITTQIGMEGMSALMTYWEKRSSGAPIRTDDTLLYQLQDVFASDPGGFATIDLLQYRSQLSDADWKMVSGWRREAIADPRKARETGSVVTDAFKQSTDALEALGLTTTGLTGRKREEVAKRVAGFQNVLAGQIRAFAAQNDGRNPTYEETQSMINRLLLPVAFQLNPPTFAGEEGRGLARLSNILGVIGWPVAAMTGGTERDGFFMFEAGQRNPDETMTVDVKFEDIPLDVRLQIERDLEEKFGEKPPAWRVLGVYERFLQSGP